MSKKKVLIFLVILVALLVNIGVLCYSREQSLDDIVLKMEVNADKRNEYQVFYSVDDLSFSEDQAKAATYNEENKVQELAFSIPANTKYIRLDFGDQSSKILLKDVRISYKFKSMPIPLEKIKKSVLEQNISSVSENDDQEMLIITNGSDPYTVINIDDLDILSQVFDVQNIFAWVKNILVCLAIDLLLIGLVKYSSKLMVLPIELFHNRKLIWQLSKNDFKTKFAGSYLGIVWAFIQPIVTVLVYWFVFQVGLRSGNVGNFPFVLWLVAGLVPWFFFSEALNSGTNALIEYSFLVKKIVFKISILPIIKIISALFVHAFFLIFTLILFTCYGYYPDLYTIQVLYFTLCMFVFVLGLTYATCAIVIFFRDLTQIINIVLQIGVWMTPIMWNIEILPESVRWIFKLNPMYYIVDGYRNALINKQWFWNDFYSTFYFWIVTALVFGFGALMFKRLKVHFADVL